MNLQEFKSKMINICRSSVQDKILSRYPITKQINLHGGLKKKKETQKNFDDAKQEMIEFITESRSDIETVEDAVNGLTNGSLLNDFPKDLGEAKRILKFENVDVWMCEFVANKLPDLTNDEQRLIVAGALQRFRGQIVE